jgi:hypothetical protein
MLSLMTSLSPTGDQVNHICGEKMWTCSKQKNLHMQKPRGKRKHGVSDQLMFVECLLCTQYVILLNWIRGN